jgi:hypothetical protein
VTRSLIALRTLVLCGCRARDSHSRLAAGLATSPSAVGSVDTGSLLPRIKHTNFLKAVADQHVPPDQVPVTEPLVGDSGTRQRCT